MNATQNCSHWICCPACGGKTRIKVYEDTVLERFPLYCPKCKQEMLISVRELNTSIIEPDAEPITYGKFPYGYRLCI